MNTGVSVLDIIDRVGRGLLDSQTQVKLDLRVGLTLVEEKASGVHGHLIQKVAELDGTFRFEFTWFPWGCEYYKQTGRMMAEDGIETLAQFDAIFLGAVRARS